MPPFLGKDNDMSKVWHFIEKWLSNPNNNNAHSKIVIYDLWKTGKASSAYSKRFVLYYKA